VAAKVAKVARLGMCARVRACVSRRMGAGAESNTA
jgi:hypothetical protein